MEYNVLFTTHARDDLKAIYEYIAFALCAPESAAGTVKRILAGAKGLAQFPESNPLYRQQPWQGLGVRFLPCKNYTVFYTVNAANRTVAVARIMYSGRDLANQLNEDDFA